MKVALTGIGLAARYLTPKSGRSRREVVSRHWTDCFPGPNHWVPETRTGRTA